MQDRLLVEFYRFQLAAVLHFVLLLILLPFFSC